MLRYLSAAAIVACIGVTLYFGHGNRPPTQAEPPLRTAARPLTQRTVPRVILRRPPAPRMHLRMHPRRAPAVTRAHAEPKLAPSSPSTPLSGEVVWRPRPAPAKTTPLKAPPPVKLKAPSPKEPLPKKIPRPKAPSPTPPTRTPAPAPSPPQPPVAEPVASPPTQPPQPAVSPPPPEPQATLGAATRPGHGYGDKNHIHIGPPGHNK